MNTDTSLPTIPTPRLTTKVLKDFKKKHGIDLVKPTEEDQKLLADIELATIVDLFVMATQYLSDPPNKKWVEENVTIDELTEILTGKK